MNRHPCCHARLLAVAVAGITAAWSASATAPISYTAEAIWKRSIHGTMYASTKDHRLVELCIEVDAVGHWLPKNALEGIYYPNLEEMRFMQGVALGHSEDFVPDWGENGLALLLETSVAGQNGNLDEGPSYFFVIDKHRVAWRVREEWKPDPSSGIFSLQESAWMAIAKGAVRHAPCLPPG